MSYHDEVHPRWRQEQTPKELIHTFDWPFWMWPDEDESLYGDMITVLDVDEFVLPHVKQHRMVVQAGGAVGVWPKRLAQSFEEVYTFEPYPPSFCCMCVNAPELNIHKFNAALGDHHEMIHMDFPEHRARSATGKENIGGFRVTGPGLIPTLRIDDFNFRGELDLIYLDIEGYEQAAIAGALKTIEDNRPIIVLEDKAGCCETFGYKVGDIERGLANKFGYKVINRFHGGRDVLLAPE